MGKDEQGEAMIRELDRLLARKAIDYTLYHKARRM